jgi:hypothetical protein
VLQEPGGKSEDFIFGWKCRESALLIGG